MNEMLYMVVLLSVKIGFGVHQTTVFLLLFFLLNYLALEFVDNNLWLYLVMQCFMTS